MQMNWCFSLSLSLSLSHKSEVQHTYHASNSCWKTTHCISCFQDHHLYFLITAVGRGWKWWRTLKLKHWGLQGKMMKFDSKVLRVMIERNLKQLAWKSAKPLGFIVTSYYTWWMMKGEVMNLSLALPGILANVHMSNWNFHGRKIDCIDEFV